MPGALIEVDTRNLEDVWDEELGLAVDSTPAFVALALASVTHAVPTTPGRATREEVVLALGG
jgi:hypothetical protein